MTLLSTQTCPARAYRRVWEGEKIGWTHDRPGGRRARGRRWRKGSLLGSGSGAKPSLEPRRKEEEELELELLSSLLAGPWWVEVVGVVGAWGLRTLAYGLSEFSPRRLDDAKEAYRARPSDNIHPFLHQPQGCSPIRMQTCLPSLVLSRPLSVLSCVDQTGKKIGRSVIARWPP